MSLFHMGLDVGSTTVKLVILDQDLKLVHGIYRRHYSDVKTAVKNIILEAYEDYKGSNISIMVTGSGGLSVKEWLEIGFIQEVVASTKAIEEYLDRVDVAIELGGEDAKITYLGHSLEQRMNSICAGGTGAFIDQMASLLETDAKGLNEMAKNHKSIYPIASRCGVFAKTDIQALINQGASKEDIAASVLQAVVNQTISNLACGRPIKGRVAFLGGPLHFMDSLLERFTKTLDLSEEEKIHPENGQLYVALGAALASVNEEPIPYEDLVKRLDNREIDTGREIKQVQVLFESQEDYEEFKERHSRYNIGYHENPKEYDGPAYLGIDAGSTTTKAIVIAEDKSILYSFYGSNKGKPLDQSIKIIKEIYEALPKAKIKNSCVTGYGEDLIKAALGVDLGEVETMAHYKGAKLFQPDVDFILDIGGQDMKAIKIEDGVINDILLNEACSSGCGSFIETFAKNVNMSVEDFVNEGLLAKNPVDLGSRCTVFMNSMVKQAQKEGSTIGDISAGLSYSVIKNAIQKVIKARDPRALGEKIVVQGGTFYGDGILRSFEIISEREAIRPNIPGLMGALGAAIIAMEKYDGSPSSLLGPEEIDNFTYRSLQGNCGKCGNNCLLTINIFSDNKKFILGNRCEKGAGVDLESKALPNLYKYKLERTFAYKGIGEKARARVGIPRVLNIYENYPFWHTFFTSLNFEPVLSDPSSRKIYELGLSSMPSETACYPAKISHGHIINLIDKNVDFIFYPSVFYEENKYKDGDNHLNCPVVAGYPEVIKHNIEDLKENNINFLNPFLTFDNKKALAKVLYKTLEIYQISYRDIEISIEKAFIEVENYRDDIRTKGEEALRFMEENQINGIVLAGRPYHVDPAINHGIPELINSLGMAVLTEDSIDHLGEINQPLRVLDQWMYHSRLYRAAEYVAKRDDLELIQLNSFGCGLDAVTTDQVHEILNRYGKIYTQLKIDEISNLGAAKIRLRSLMAAMKEREGKEVVPHKRSGYEIRPFTKEDKKNHTILMPQMAPIQFRIIEGILRDSGYNVVVLAGKKEDIVNQGLKYVNNDACYPSIIVIGQFIEALKSGEYDLENTSLLLSQTGGMCRASNYIGFLRKALVEAGLEEVKVISVSVQGIEKNPGFTYSISMINKLIMGTILGDLLQRVSLRTRPYELEKGTTNRYLEEYLDRIVKDIPKLNKRTYIKYINNIVDDFSSIEITDESKPKVGIVGEILAKYHPDANNDLIATLEEEGAEVLISDLMDFMMYSLYNSNYKNEYLGKSYTNKVLSNIGIDYVESYRKHLRDALDRSERFTSPLKIEDLADLASQIISLGNQSGEGWLLTAEMFELVEDGAENVVCVQPFACLPNHITGKGMIKAIRDINPRANIIPIDYDPGASEVNQVNRLKLMLSRAEDNL